MVGSFKIRKIRILNLWLQLRYQWLRPIYGPQQLQLRGHQSLQGAAKRAKTRIVFGQGGNSPKLSVCGPYTHRRKLSNQRLHLSDHIVGLVI